MMCDLFLMTSPHGTWGARYKAGNLFRYSSVLIKIRMRVLENVPTPYCYYPHIRAI